MEKIEALESRFTEGIFIEEEEKNVPFSIPLFSRHNAYEIYILLKGERTVYLDKRILLTISGDVLMIKSNVYHRSEGITPYKGICIQFTEEHINQYFTDKAKQKMLRCFETNIISLDKNALSEILYYLFNMGEDPENRFMNLASLLALLNKTVLSSDIAEKESKAVSYKYITNFINDNYTCINGLDDIADRFKISKEYLCALFKKQMGMTVISYLNNIRIQQACRLLETTDYSVDRVGAECGFTSNIYFHRLFKKVMNYTPAKYRRLVSKNRVKE